MIRRTIIVLLYLFKIIGLEAEGNRYELIQQALIESNLAYADKLIEQEKRNNIGDPKLEFYEIELWLKKANELYEKKQFKDSLVYYYKLGAIYPNHPTVRERIEIWKNKNPENEILPKLNLIKKNDQPKDIILPNEFSELGVNNSNSLISLNERLVNLTFEISHLKSNLIIFMGILIGVGLTNILFAVVFLVGRLKK